MLVKNINSPEIVKVASGWFDFVYKLEISKHDEILREQNKKDLEQRKLDFLKNNATYILRKQSRPQFFYEIDREMNGKYGWFSSYGKSYNMTEYYSGWEFQTAELLKEFNNIL